MFLRFKFKSYSTLIFYLNSRLHNAHKKRIKIGRWLDRKAEHIQRRHQHAQAKRNNRKHAHKNKQQQFWRDIKREMRFAKKAMKVEFSELTKEMIQAKRQEIIAAKRLEKATEEAKLEEKLSAIDEQIKEREHNLGNDGKPIPHDISDSRMDKKERSLAKIHAWLKKYKPRRHHKNGKSHHE